MIEKETELFISETTSDEIIRIHPITLTLTSAKKDILEVYDDNYTFIKLYGESLILYNVRQNKIFVHISKETPEKLLLLIGVKICKLITDFLIKEKIYCIHSSVCTFKKQRGNGIAFLGESGAGKTSLAYQMYKCGEQITNDDVAYFRIFSSKMTVYKNSQFIGFDDNNLDKNFSECKTYVAKKDGLELDKNRIDLLKKDPLAYADEIQVRYVIILDKIRAEKPQLCECNLLEAYKKIVQSLVPYLTGRRYELIDEIANKILKSTCVYKLQTCPSVSTTVDYLLSKDLN